MGKFYIILLIAYLLKTIAGIPLLVSIYKTGETDWYKDRSKAPKNNPTKLLDIDKQRIIETRKRLESERFAQISASAIKWELNKSGFNFPSDRTINRVLNQEGLVKKKSLHS